MRVASFCILLLSAAPAFAQSNIGLTDYPAPKCAVPPSIDTVVKPVPPEQGRNEGPADAALYNSKVRAYNTAMRAHNDGVKLYAECVQGYIAAGKADIERIQAAVDKAVAVANGQ